MKYIKTYESVTEDNILKRFTKQEVIDMFQEISDDFNLHLTIENIRICEINSTDNAASIAIDVIDYRVKYRIGYIDNFDTRNCYEIVLGDEDVDLLINLEDLKSILDAKRNLFDINYIISNADLEQIVYHGPPTVVINWKIFLY